MAPSDRLKSISVFASPDVRSGLLLLGLSILIAVVSVGVLDPAKPRPRDVFLSPPQIQRFTFGTQEQVADALWMRALQDFDYCEKEVSTKVCRQDGWLYRMLDLATDLSPRFRMAYSAGGLALTVLVNDFAGASKIFEKGLKEFPNDLTLLERAAYHALYEEKDDRKAAGLLERAAKAGAPPWYYLLATKLYGHEGRTELAENLLRDLENAPNPDPVLVKTLRERVEALKSGN